MYNLIRFYNQNRKKIIKIILVIVFIIGLIQLLDFFSKRENKNEDVINEINKTKYSNTVISDKSAISGSSVSENKLKKDTDIINDFFKYCKNGNIESAYNLLTDECKEEMYTTIDDFKTMYYDVIFNGERKSYTIENWNDNIYSVKITGDILSTGKLNNDEIRQDYVTVVEREDGYKLNINNYIEREKPNKVTKKNNVVVTVTQIDTYMDYKIYNLYVENNSDDTIVMDLNNDIKSIYLLDKNDQKSYSFNNDTDQNKFVVKSKFKNNIKMKFNNSYSSTRKMKSIVFSKFISNYDEYSKLENKSDYSNWTELKIQI